MSVGESWSVRAKPSDTIRAKGGAHGACDKCATCSEERVFILGRTTARPAMKWREMVSVDKPCPYKLGIEPEHISRSAGANDDDAGSIAVPKSFRPSGLGVGAFYTFRRER
jgi:hypothetical protein